MQVRRIADWLQQATGGAPLAVRAGYRLDGTVQDDADYFTVAFAAPLAVACMVAPGHPQLLTGLYDAIRATDEGYYEDSLALLSLVVLTGNWWLPGGMAMPVPATSPVTLTIWPSPFNPTCLVSFHLATRGAVRLTVHDPRGQVLFRRDREELPAGDWHWSWDGRDMSGRPLPSGTYLFHLQTTTGTTVRKATLLR